MCKHNNKDYDNTVARISGNLLSGLVNIESFKSVSQDGLKTNLQEVVRGAVAIARAITKEVKRTEPKEL